MLLNQTPLCLQKNPSLKSLNVKILDFKQCPNFYKKILLRISKAGELGQKAWSSTTLILNWVMLRFRSILKSCKDCMEVYGITIQQGEILESL